MDIRIMKETKSKHMGPFGDVEVENGKEKQDKHKKEACKVGDKEKTNVKLKKGNIPPSQNIIMKNENNKKVQEYKKKERERIERYEKEVAEAERNEREAEFERSEKDRIRNKTKFGAPLSRRPRRPPAGYKDPHEVCKQVLPTKVKEKKREEIKALMNCIAFTPSQTDLRATSFEDENVSSKIEKKEANTEETDNSSSSESTSITDVTPRSSSSGCSSMSKQSMSMDKVGSGKRDDEMEALPSAKKVIKSKRGKESLKNKNTRKISDADKEKKEIPPEDDAKNLTEIELEEMKYMQDAFENLDLDEETSEFASSIISGLSEERRAKCNRKNMTFTNEQLREIERVNLILLNKIMKHRKPKTKPLLNPAPVNRRTSASINRSRMEEKIERENKMLLKKLQSAKGTTNTLPKKGNQPQFYR